MRFTIAAAAIFALAACQPAADKPKAPTPEELGQDDPKAPMEPAPDPTPVVFEAMSKTAMSLTGSVSLSAQPRPGPNAAPRMRLTTGTGVVFDTELMPGGAEQATAIKWKDIFNAEVVTSGNPPPGAPSVDLHAVLSETVPKEATNGGFCGKEPTAYIAMATGLDIQGQKYMSIAAFTGDVWPPADDKGLCGTFNYTPPETK